MRCRYHGRPGIPSACRNARSVFISARFEGGGCVLVGARAGKQCVHPPPGGIG